MLLQGLPGIISEQNPGFRALTPAGSLKCSYGAAVLPEKSCHMDNFRLSPEKEKKNSRQGDSTKNGLNHRLPTSLVFLGNNPPTVTLHRGQKMPTSFKT